ncbi:hypothetical protein HZ326_20647 [Fusarium oxysporum f. sp. albedinis]|nr:hypothetical protein HZ326_20647 [Fusarium oxysporum f. sp. albedinis]
MYVINMNNSGSFQITGRQIRIGCHWKDVPGPIPLGRHDKACISSLSFVLFFFFFGGGALAHVRMLQQVPPSQFPPIPTSIRVVASFVQPSSLQLRNWTHDMQSFLRFDALQSGMRFWTSKYSISQPWFPRVQLWRRTKNNCFF